MATLVTAIRTVLVVDDDKLVLSSTRRALARQFEVTTAGSVKDAEEAASTTSFDGAIVDLFLDGTTGGLDVIRLLKARGCKRIVAMSGQADFDHGFDVAHAGADAIAYKPMYPGELISKLVDGATWPPSRRTVMPLARLERRYVQSVVDACKGNKSLAGRLWGIDRASVRRILNQDLTPEG